MEVPILPIARERQSSTGWAGRQEPAPLPQGDRELGGRGGTWSRRCRCESPVPTREVLQTRERGEALSWKGPELLRDMEGGSRAKQEIAGAWEEPRARLITAPLSPSTGSARPQEAGGNADWAPRTCCPSAPLLSQIQGRRRQPEVTDALAREVGAGSQHWQQREATDHGGEYRWAHWGLTRLFGWVCRTRGSTCRAGRGWEVRTGDGMPSRTPAVERRGVEGGEGSRGGMTVLSTFRMGGFQGTGDGRTGLGEKQVRGQ